MDERRRASPDGHTGRAQVALEDRIAASDHPLTARKKNERNDGCGRASPLYPTEVLEYGLL
jgi:hypothetical protein